MSKQLTILLISVFALTNCSKDDGLPQTCFIQDIPVQVSLNLDLPLYQHLKIPGQWTYIDGGVKGIFLVHNFDDNFIALDRVIPDAPDSCNVAIADSTSPFLFNCDKTRKYEYYGGVLEGNTQCPLKPYPVFVSGNFITIRN